MSRLATFPRWAGRSEDCACVPGGGRVAEADTHAWWAELGSFYQYYQPRSGHRCLAGAGAFALRAGEWLPQREWPLGVGDAMAGYEYVSSEQLAGFDKYKVARAPRAPCSSWSRPLPGGGGLARSVSPCAAWPRAGWRAFLRGSRGVLGPWGGGAWGHPRLAAPTRHPPGIALAFGDRSASGEPENSLRFFTSSSSSSSFSPLRSDAVCGGS